MNTALSKHFSPASPRCCRALTILEMLVSTALLAFIVLGLTAMFIQVQKAFKMGIKQSSVTDSGRSVIDMIASDLSQLSDAGFPIPQQPFFQPTPLPQVNLYWQWNPGMDLIQSDGTVTRTNQLQDIFAMVETNNTWVGIGYMVSNWFTANGNAIPGVGTLYRYVAQTNAPLDATNSLFSGFYFGTGTNANYHRVADGVVHLKIYAYDGNGNEDAYEIPYDYPSSGSSAILLYPTVVTNLVNGLPFYQTNHLPHSIDIELGILEPETFEHVRALFTSGATAAAEQLLTNSPGKVEIFRQHIIVPAANSSPLAGALNP